MTWRSLSLSLIVSLLAISAWGNPPPEEGDAGSILDALNALRLVKEEPSPVVPEKKEADKESTKSDCSSSCSSTLVSTKKPVAKKPAVKKVEPPKVEKKAEILMLRFVQAEIKANMGNGDSAFAQLVDDGGNRYRIWCDRRTPIDEAKDPEMDKLSNSLASLNEDKEAFIFEERNGKSRFDICMEEIKRLDQREDRVSSDFPHIVRVTIEDDQKLINASFINGQLRVDDTGFVLKGKVLPPDSGPVNSFRMVRTAFENIYSSPRNMMMKVKMNKGGKISTMVINKWIQPDAFTQLFVYDLVDGKLSLRKELFKREKELLIHEGDETYAQDLDVSLTDHFEQTDLTYYELLEEKRFDKDIAYETLERIGEDVVDGHHCYILSFRFKEHSDSIFGRMKVWISSDENNLVKIDKFDRSLKFIGTDRMNGIKKFDGGVSPQNTVMRTEHAETKNTTTFVEMVRIQPVEPVIKIDFHGAYFDLE